MSFVNMGFSIYENVAKVKEIYFDKVVLQFKRDVILMVYV